MKLEDYQNLIKELSSKRGFDKDTAEDRMLILTEEVGELAKAIRQQRSRLKNGDHSKKHEIESEMTDVFWVLLALANLYDINLAEAFEAKEKVNRQRFNEDYED